MMMLTGVWRQKARFMEYLLPGGVDLERSHDKVRLMVDQFSNKSIPAAIDNPTPGSVLDSLQGKVKGQVVGELPDEVDTEARAAFELG